MASAATNGDRLKTWLEFGKAYGVPTVLLLAVLWWIVVPIIEDYRAVVKQTVEIQQQTATTLQRISEVQAAQSRMLEELSRLSERSVECLQRVEDTVQRIDRGSP